MPRSEPLDLLQGTLDLLILRTLSDGPLHGYAISRSIRQRSRELLNVQDAALYQALRRLEGKGWVKAEWGRTDTKRRARFYALTAAGRKRLDREMRVWERYTEAVARVLDPGAEGSG